MKCTICEIGCRPPEGARGRCNMYENKNGVMLERFPFTHIAAVPVSIETIPITHFRSKTKFLQLGGVGCNFSCKGCVSDIFTHRIDRFTPALVPLNLEDVIRKAKYMNCAGIVWCMNDPTVNHPSFLELAKAARAEGLLVGCSSNVYHTREAATQLAQVLDFINCGLKGATDDAYRRCGVPFADPVFRNIRLFRKTGVHV